MIAANELRIGNWIEDSESKERYQVEWFSKSCEDLANPIPLTSEILEMCGFEKEETDTHYLYGNDIYHVRYIGNGMFYFEMHEKRLRLIKFVHQLQNLYFDLTGEELKINLSISVA